MELGTKTMVDLLNIIMRKNTCNLEQSTRVDDWKEPLSLLIHAQKSRTLRSIGLLTSKR